MGWVLLFLKIRENTHNHGNAFEKRDREELKGRPKRTLGKAATDPITSCGSSIWPETHSPLNWFSSSQMPVCPGQGSELPVELADPTV